jgi:hypothetical protein
VCIRGEALAHALASQVFVHGVDIDDLQGDVAPAPSLANRVLSDRVTSDLLNGRPSLAGVVPAQNDLGPGPGESQRRLVPETTRRACDHGCSANPRRDFGLVP